MKANAKLMIVWSAALGLMLTACGERVDHYYAGPKGDTGAAGQDGKDGNDGKDGYSTVFETLHVSGNVNCPAGGNLLSSGLDLDRDGILQPDEMTKSFYVCDGQAGLNGINGTNGADGQDGQDGADGIDGTQVFNVKLCPGTPSYPSTFVEYGVCIDGNLYGVYSANGGFWTYLPPGNYSSNGINSTCNLTVHANCQVTN